MGLFKVSNLLRSRQTNPIAAKGELTHYADPKTLDRNHHHVFKEIVKEEIEEDLDEALTSDQAVVEVRPQERRDRKDRRFRKPKKNRKIQDLEAIVTVQINEFKKHYDEEFRRFFLGITTKEAFKAKAGDYKILCAKFEQEKALLVRGINQGQLWNLKKFVDNYDPGAKTYRHSAFE